MKKLLLVCSLMATVVTIGCLKGNDVEPCVVKTLDEDRPVMTKYAEDNSINATEDPTGILYEIIDAGSETHPSSSSEIIAKYTGMNLGGQTFDEGQFDRPIALSNLIRGWQVILPKIGVGGKVKMIIPSSLAYGCNAPTLAVLNQPLYFDVELISIQ